MTDPDGLALLLVMACLGLVVALLAACVEAYLARDMRRRRRRAEAYRRYVELCDREAIRLQARHVEAACFYHQSKQP